MKTQWGTVAMVDAIPAVCFVTGVILFQVDIATQINQATIFYPAVMHCEFGSSQLKTATGVWDSMFPIRQLMITTVIFLNSKIIHQQI